MVCFPIDQMDFRARIQFTHIMSKSCMLEKCIQSDFKLCGCFNASQRNICLSWPYLALMLDWLRFTVMVRGEIERNANSSSAVDFAAQPAKTTRLGARICHQLKCRAGISPRECKLRLLEQNCIRSKTSHDKSYYYGKIGTETTQVKAIALLWCTSVKNDVPPKKELFYSTVVLASLSRFQQAAFVVWLSKGVEQQQNLRIAHR